MDTTARRIKFVTVKGLFNQFDHHIDFNLEERITILHGINGVGKTTLLRMIDDLFKHEIADLDKIPFSSFVVGMVSGDMVRIEKNNMITVFFNDENIHIEIPKQTTPISRKETIKLLYTNDFRSKIGKFHTQLIKASRLFQHTTEQDSPNNKETIIDTVNVYAKEFKQLIDSTMADYAKKSQELEQTFPFRLLKAKPDYTDEQLKSHFEALLNSRQELREIGLLPQATDSETLDAASIDSLETQHAEVMKLYVKDSEEKLAALMPLGQKIKLLLTIINSKFQGKSLRIDEKKGLIAIGKDGEIDLSLLSSGEQHELVMFYDLIFKVAPDTLVMIDEPELSLHISWQHTFIEELKRIIALAKFDVLIATHSPTIVGNNAHLMVALDANG